MTTYQRIEVSPLYKPRQWAAPAHRSKAKMKVVWVHRRGGKGWFAQQEGIAAYVERLLHPPQPMKIPRFHAWSVAPTFSQARQTENELEAFLPEQLRPPTTEWDQSRGHRRDEHTFELLFDGWGSGLWEIKSAHEPEALQTVGLDFLHIQECQDIPDAAYYKLLPTLRDQDRLGLSVWEGIPPDDPGHWFAHLMASAQNDQSGEMLAVVVPFTENPDLGDEVKASIERDRERMLDREWRRHYMVELSEGIGSFLGNVDGCISLAPLLEAPEEGHRYVMGIDVAKKVDFTVIIVMDACHRRLVWQRRFGGMDWVVQEETILGISERFRPSRIRMDSTGVGDPLYDRLYYRGLPVEPFIFTNQTKYQVLIDLAIGIEKRHVSYPIIPIMLREMKSLRSVRLLAGAVRIEGPAGAHDDYPMALALCYSLCDPAPDMMMVGKLGSMRYVPMQEEVEAGGGGIMQRALRERLSEKMRKRAEAVGVT